MKKHFFNVIAALALVCGVFAFSGCADYETDINNLNERLDELEAGQIASLEEQLATLGSALDEANGLIETLQGNVGDLEAADEAMGQQIDALNGEIGNVKDEIADINSEITAINSEIASVEQELSEKIDAAVSELKAEDAANAQRIDKLVQDLADAKEELKGLIADAQDILEEMIEKGDQENADAIAGLSDKLAELSERIATAEKDIEGKYNELMTAINGVQDRLGEHATQIAELFKNYEELNQKHEALRDEFDEQVQKLADLYATVAALQAEVKALQDLTAGLPALETLVDSIKTNYLSKEEAQNTYATLENVKSVLDSLGKVNGRLAMLEALNIGERLSDLENNYKDLNDVIIPGIKDRLTAVETLAGDALKKAEAAQKFAESVLTELRSFKDALGTYAEAGALEAKMESLDSMLASLGERDKELLDLIEDYNTALNGKIDALDSRVAGQLADITSNIDSIENALNEAIEDIRNTMVSQEEFGKFFTQELDKALANGGMISEAIVKAVEDAKNELQGKIDGVNTRIDEEILPAIDNLISDVAVITGEISDKIQSLVFVPEYKDGMATSYYYTVAEKPLVDFQRVQATFQVTPAKLAASISNENAMLLVVPVQTRAAAPATQIAENLEIKVDGNTGRIDIDALVPTKIGNDIAIALYVADPNVVSEIVNNSENFENIDLGDYVSSEYVQVKIDEKASALDDKYVLYNFTEEEEFPATLEVEKDWTMAPATVTFYEGYELAFDMAGDIVRLEEAAEALRLPVEAITPDYEPVVLYTPVMGNGVTISLDEEKGYGMIASMPATSEEAVKHVGDIAYVNNIFNINGKAVIENATSYEIIPVTFELNLPNLNEVDFPKNKIEWTYQLAKDHKILYKGTQEPLDLDEMLIENWDSVAVLPGAAKNIYEIINDGTPSFDKVLRTVEGGRPEDVTDEFKAYASDVNGYVRINPETFKVGLNVPEITIDNYEFEKGKEVTYNVRKVYVNSDNTAKVIFNIDYTLGEMPVDREFNLAEEVGLDQLGIPFIASDMIEIMLGEENAAHTYYKDITPMEWAYPAEGGFFKDFEDFRQSLYDNNASEYGVARIYTVFTEKYNDDLRKWEPLEDYNGNPIAKEDVELLSNYWTFLSILNEPADAKEESIRVSSSNIAKIGDQFRFTTKIETWYGVEYTFTTEAVIDAPSYSLIYVNAFAPGGIVDLRSHVDNQLNKYVIDPIDFSNYLQVEGTEGSDDVLKVKFERKTQWDPEHGYNHVPNPSPWAVRVDNATGILGSSTLDWNSGYTALDYDFEAVLYVEVRGQEIEVNRLPLTLNAIDPIALSADENISLTRPVGKNLVIKPWQYLTINGVVEFDGNKNNTEYKNLAQGPETTTNGEDIGNGPVEYWQITSINDGTLVPYGGELTFDSANMRLIYAASGTPVENQSKLYTYDPTLGTITFTNDFSSLAEDVKLIVPAKVTYTLDGGGVWSKTCDIEMNIPHERVTE